MISCFWKLPVLAVGLAAVVFSEDLDVSRLYHQWNALSRELDSRAEFSDFKAFYQRVSPDLLSDWQKKALQSEKLGYLFLENLARDYVYMRRLKLRKPKDYQERVQILRDEYEIRKLGRRISELKLRLKEGEDTSEILELTEELKKRLLRSFEDSQHRQKLELIRLESEVQYLRQLVENRSQNKEFILKQRLEILCGKDDH